MASCASEFVPEATQFFGACSGNGKCINSTCFCDPGWTGKSDLLNTEGLDCQIYKPVIIILWTLCLAYVVSLWIRVVPKMRLRLKQYQELRQRRRAVGKPFNICHSPSMISMILYYGMCGTCFLAFGFLKIFDFDDELRVGVSLTATALFFVTISGFYLGFVFFQPFLLGVLLRGSGPRKNFLSKINYAVAFSGVVVSIADAGLPFIIVADGGQANSLAYTLMIVYYTLNALGLLGYCVQATLTMHLSNRILKAAYTVGRGEMWILEVKGKVAELQLEIIVLSLMQAAAYLTFAYFPFLWNKSDYFLPVSWGLAARVWYRIFNSVVDSTAAGGGASIYEEPESESVLELGMGTSLAAVPSSANVATVGGMRTFGGGKDKSPKKKNRKQQKKKGWFARPQEHASSAVTTEVHT